jgi:hypothetical protein
VRYFKEGDIVFLRVFNDHQGDWEAEDDFPFLVIEAGKMTKIMGGKSSRILTVPSIMLVDEEEKRMLKPCLSSEER